MKTLTTIIIFALLALFYVVFVYYIVGEEQVVREIRTTETRVKTVNMTATVPVNPCNECLAGAETEDEKVWCFNKFCR